MHTHAWRSTRATWTADARCCSAQYALTSGAMPASICEYSAMSNTSVVTLGSYVPNPPHTHKHTHTCVCHRKQQSNTDMSTHTRHNSQDTRREREGRERETDRQTDTDRHRQTQDKPARNCSRNTSSSDSGTAVCMFGRTAVKHHRKVCA